MANQFKILKRFFAGNYSRKDYQQLLEKFRNKENDIELMQAMEAHWAEFCNDPIPEGNVDYIFQKIRHRIRIEEKPSPRKNLIWENFRRVAAILFFPLLFSFLAYLFFMPEGKNPDGAYAEIQCPLGVRTKFSLPDGSTGYLNSGSSLKFPARFEGERCVELSGEAFFNVRHDEKSPFLVKTKNFEIRDIGTTFNVVSYPGDKTEEVILLSGCVDVTEKNGTSLAKLFPDRQLVYYTDTHKYSEKSVIANQYISWTEGKLVFRNEDMEQVAKRLSRWYNAEIVVDDPRLKNYTFHATFIDEQLDEVLKLLSITTPISYSEEKRPVSSDGVYPKRKIFLEINPEKLEEFK